MSDTCSWKLFKNTSFQRGKQKILVKHFYHFGSDYSEIH